MAQIKDLKLTVEKGSMASKAKIKANFTVVFTPAEKRLNLQFGLFVMLYEVDFRPDILIPLPNGFNAMRLANLDVSLTGTKNTQDDAIGWTKSGIIQPNGRNHIAIELAEEVRLINKNVSNESFRAGVYVSPEISAGFAWSNEVAIPCDSIKQAPIETKEQMDPKVQAVVPTKSATVQTTVEQTAPQITTQKTITKEIVTPKTPPNPKVEQAVVKKVVVKKVITETKDANPVKQSPLLNKVVKAPVVKKVVKKVITSNQVGNTVKQAALSNREVNDAVQKMAEPSKPAAKKVMTKRIVSDAKAGIEKGAAKKSPPKS